LNAEEYFYFLCLLDVFEKQLVGIPIATIHAPLHEDFMVGLLKKNFVCPTYVLSLNNSNDTVGKSEKEAQSIPPTHILNYSMKGHM
jgi:hypothetical protein